MLGRLSSPIKRQLDQSAQPWGCLISASDLSRVQLTIMGAGAGRGESGPTRREALAAYGKLMTKGCQMSEWELAILWLNAHHMSHLRRAHCLQHQFKLSPH